MAPPDQPDPFARTRDLIRRGMEVVRANIASRVKRTIGHIGDQPVVSEWKYYGKQTTDEALEIQKQIPGEQRRVLRAGDRCEERFEGAQDVYWMMVNAGFPLACVSDLGGDPAAYEWPHRLQKMLLRAGHEFDQRAGYTLDNRPIGATSEIRALVKFLLLLGAPAGMSIVTVKRQYEEAIAYAVVAHEAEIAQYTGTAEERAVHIEEAIVRRMWPGDGPAKLAAKTSGRYVPLDERERDKHGKVCNNKTLIPATEKLMYMDNRAGDASVTAEMNSQQIKQFRDAVVALRVETVPETSVYVRPNNFIVDATHYNQDISAFVADLEKAMYPDFYVTCSYVPTEGRLYVWLHSYSAYATMMRACRQVHSAVQAVMSVCAGGRNVALGDRLMVAANVINDRSHADEPLLSRDDLIVYRNRHKRALMQQVSTSETLSDENAKELVCAMLAGLMQNSVTTAVNERQLYLERPGFWLPQSALASELNRMHPSARFLHLLHLAGMTHHVACTGKFARAAHKSGLVIDAASVAKGPDGVTAFGAMFGTQGHARRIDLVWRESESADPMGDFRKWIAAIVETGIYTARSHDDDDTGDRVDAYLRSVDESYTRYVMRHHLGFADQRGDPVHEIDAKRARQLVVEYVRRQAHVHTIKAHGVPVARVGLEPTAAFVDRAARSALDFVYQHNEYDAADQRTIDMMRKCQQEVSQMIREKKRITRELTEWKAAPDSDQSRKEIEMLNRHLQMCNDLLREKITDRDDALGATLPNAPPTDAPHREPDDSELLAKIRELIVTHTGGLPLGTTVPVTVLDDHGVYISANVASRELLIREANEMVLRCKGDDEAIRGWNAVSSSVAESFDTSVDASTTPAILSAYKNRNASMYADDSLPVAVLMSETTVVEGGHSERSHTVHSVVAEWGAAADTQSANSTNPVRDAVAALTQVDNLSKEQTALEGERRRCTDGIFIAMGRVPVLESEAPESMESIGPLKSELYVDVAFAETKTQMKAIEEMKAYHNMIGASIGAIRDRPWNPDSLEETKRLTLLMERALRIREALASLVYGQSRMFDIPESDTDEKQAQVLLRIEEARYRAHVSRFRWNLCSAILKHGNLDVDGRSKIKKQMEKAHRTVTRFDGIYRQIKEYPAWIAEARAAAAEFRATEEAMARDVDAKIAELRRLRSEAGASKGDAEKAARLAAAIADTEKTLVVMHENHAAHKKALFAATYRVGSLTDAHEAASGHVFADAELFRQAIVTEVDRRAMKEDARNAHDADVWCADLCERIRKHEEFDERVDSVKGAILCARSEAILATIANADECAALAARVEAGLAWHEAAVHDVKRGKKGPEELARSIAGINETGVALAIRRRQVAGALERIESSGNTSRELTESLTADLHADDSLLKKLAEVKQKYPSLETTIEQAATEISHRNAEMHNKWLEDEKVAIERRAAEKAIYDEAKQAYSIQEMEYAKIDRLEASAKVRRDREVRETKEAIVAADDAYAKALDAYRKLSKSERTDERRLEWAAYTSAWKAKKKEDSAAAEVATQLRNKEIKEYRFKTSTRAAEAMEQKELDEREREAIAERNAQREEFETKWKSKDAVDYNMDVSVAVKIARRFAKSDQAEQRRIQADQREQARKAYNENKVARARDARSRDAEKEWAAAEKEHTRLIRAEQADTVERARRKAAYDAKKTKSSADHKTEKNEVARRARDKAAFDKRVVEWERAVVQRRRAHDAYVQTKATRVTKEAVGTYSKQRVDEARRAWSAEESHVETAPPADGYVNRRASLLKEAFGTRRVADRFSKPAATRLPDPPEERPVVSAPAWPARPDESVPAIEEEEAVIEEADELVREIEFHREIDVIQLELDSHVSEIGRIDAELEAGADDSTRSELHRRREIESDARYRLRTELSVTQHRVAAVNEFYSRISAELDRETATLDQMREHLASTTETDPVVLAERRSELDLQTTKVARAQAILDVRSLVETSDEWKVERAQSRMMAEFYVDLEQAESRINSVGATLREREATFESTENVKTREKLEWTIDRMKVDWHMAREEFMATLEKALDLMAVAPHTKRMWVDRSLVDDALREDVDGTPVVDQAPLDGVDEERIGEELIAAYERTVSVRECTVQMAIQQETVAKTERMAYAHRLAMVEAVASYEELKRSGAGEEEMTKAERLRGVSTGLLSGTRLVALQKNVAASMDATALVTQFMARGEQCLNDVIWLAEQKKTLDERIRKLGGATSKQPACMRAIRHYSNAEVAAAIAVTRRGGFKQPMHVRAVDRYSDAELADAIAEISNGDVAHASHGSVLGAMTKTNKAKLMATVQEYMEWGAKSEQDRTRTIDDTESLDAAKRHNDELVRTVAEIRHMSVLSAMTERDMATLMTNVKEYVERGAQAEKNRLSAIRLRGVAERIGEFLAHRQSVADEFAGEKAKIDSANNERAKALDSRKQLSMLDDRLCDLREKIAEVSAVESQHSAELRMYEPTDTKIVRLMKVIRELGEDVQEFAGRAVQRSTEQQTALQEARKRAKEEEAELRKATKRGDPIPDGPMAEALRALVGKVNDGHRAWEQMEGLKKTIAGHERTLAELKEESKGEVAKAMRQDKHELRALVAAKDTPPSDMVAEDEPTMYSTVVALAKQARERSDVYDARGSDVSLMGLGVIDAELNRWTGKKESTERTIRFNIANQKETRLELAIIEQMRPALDTLHQKEKEIADMKARREDHNQLERELARARKALEKLPDEIASLKTVYAQLRQERGRLTKLISQYDVQLATGKRSDRTLEEKEKILAEVEEMTAEIDEMTAKYNKQALEPETELAEAKKRLDEAEKDALANAKPSEAPIKKPPVDRLAKAQRQLEEAIAAVAKAHGQSSDAKTKQKRIAIANKQLSVARAAVDKATTELGAAGEGVDGAPSIPMTDDVRKARSRLAECQSLVDAIKDLAKAEAVVSELERTKTTTSDEERTKKQKIKVAMTEVATKRHTVVERSSHREVARRRHEKLDKQIRQKKVDRERLMGGGGIDREILKKQAELRDHKENLAQIEAKMAETKAEGKTKESDLERMPEIIEQRAAAVEKDRAVGSDIKQKETEREKMAAEIETVKDNARKMLEETGTTLMDPVSWLAKLEIDEEPKTITVDYSDIRADAHLKNDLSTVANKIRELNRIQAWVNEFEKGETQKAMYERIDGLLCTKDLVTQEFNEVTMDAKDIGSEMNDIEAHLNMNKLTFYPLRSKVHSSNSVNVNAFTSDSGFSRYRNDVKKIRTMHLKLKDAHHREAVMNRDYGMFQAAGIKNAMIFAYKELRNATKEKETELDQALQLVETGHEELAEQIEIYVSTAKELITDNDVLQKIQDDVAEGARVEGQITHSEKVCAEKGMDRLRARMEITTIEESLRGDSLSEDVVSAKTAEMETLQAQIAECTKTIASHILTRVEKKAMRRKTAEVRQKYDSRQGACLRLVQLSNEKLALADADELFKAARLELSQAAINRATYAVDTDGLREGEHDKRWSTWSQGHQTVQCNRLTMICKAYKSILNQERAGVDVDLLMDQGEKVIMIEKEAVEPTTKRKYLKKEEVLLEVEAKRYQTKLAAVQQEITDAAENYASSKVGAKENHDIGRETHYIKKEFYAEEGTKGNKRRGPTEHEFATRDAKIALHELEKQRTQIKMRIQAEDKKRIDAEEAEEERAEAAAPPSEDRLRLVQVTAEIAEATEAARQSESLVGALFKLEQEKQEIATRIHFARSKSRSSSKAVATPESIADDELRLADVKVEIAKLKEAMHTPEPTQDVLNRLDKEKQEIASRIKTARETKRAQRDASRADNPLEPSADRRLLLDVEAKIAEAKKTVRKLESSNDSFEEGTLQMSSVDNATSYSLRAQDATMDLRELLSTLGRDKAILEKLQSKLYRVQDEHDSANARIGVLKQDTALYDKNKKYPGSLTDEETAQLSRQQAEWDTVTAVFNRTKSLRRSMPDDIKKLTTKIKLMTARVKELNRLAAAAKHTQESKVNEMNRLDAADQLTKESQMTATDSWF